MAKSCNISSLEDFIKCQDIPVLSDIFQFGKYVMNDLYKNNLDMGNIINYLIKRSGFYYFQRDNFQG